MCVEASGQRYAQRFQAMVVGEAPGRNEDETGIPFVGRAGQVLDRALKHAFHVKDPREQVFVTNIVKCRPPGNRDPEESEIDACVSAYLTREIEAVNATVLLACGNVAAGVLCGETGMSRMRGRWYELDADTERWVMPTWHPAYIVYRGYDSEAWTQFREDVRVFAERAIAGQAALH